MLFQGQSCGAGIQFYMFLILESEFLVSVLFLRPFMLQIRTIVEIRFLAANRVLNGGAWESSCEQDERYNKDGEARNGGNCYHPYVWRHKERAGHWILKIMAVAIGEGHLAGLLPQAKGHTNLGDLAGKVLRK